MYFTHTYTNILLFFFKMCVYIYTYICVYVPQRMVNNTHKQFKEKLWNECVYICICVYIYICIHMCLLPFPAVANYSKVSGFKQYKFVVFHFGGQKSEIRCWQDCVSSDGSEWSISLPFPPSRGCLHSWLMDPTSIFPTSSLASSNVSLCFCRHIAFSWFWPSCLAFTRTPMVTLGPTE